MTTIKEKIFIGILFLLLALSPFFQGGNNDILLALLYFVGVISGAVFLNVRYLSGIKEQKENSTLYLSFFSLLIFLLSLFVLNFFSKTPYLSWVIFFEFLLYSLFALIIAFFDDLKNYLPLIFNVFFLLGLILSLYGLYVYEVANYTRVMSFFYQPNAFAGWLLFVLPLAFFLFFREREVNKILIFLLGTSLILTAFILANSRGAFLSFILPLFFLFYFLYKYKPNKKDFFQKIAALIVLTFIFVTLFVSLKEGKFSLFALRSFKKTEGMPVPSTIFLRWKFWEGAFLMAKDRPLTGYGLGSYKDAYPQYQYAPLAYTKYPHNYYIEILGETGIFGALSFYIFIFSVLLLGMFCFKKARRDKRYLPGFFLFLSLLGPMVHNGVEMDCHFRANLLYLFIFLALLWGFLRKKEKTSISHKKPFCIFEKVVKIVLIFIFLVFSFGFFLKGINFPKGEDLKKKGRQKEAISKFQTARSILPDPEIYLEEGISNFVIGNYSKAQDLAERGLSLNKIDASLYQLLGRSLLKQKEIKKAIDAFRKGVTLSPYSMDIWQDLADAYLTKGNLRKAREVLMEGVSHIDDLSINYFKGQRRGFAKQLGIKEEEFSLPVLENFSKIYEKLSEVENFLGNKTKAQEYSQKATEIIKPLGEEEKR